MTAARDHANWQHVQVSHSLFQAHGKWGRSKRLSSDERGLGPRAWNRVRVLIQKRLWFSSFEMIPSFRETNFGS